MESNDIIKALECCANCENCSYETTNCILAKEMECRSLLAQNALDLINRQRTEIERLKQRNAVYEAANRCIVWQRDRRDREIEELHSQIAGLNIYKSKIKAEAYKEFAEKVKEFMHNKFKALDEYEFEYITERDIDNLLKEMVGENND